jgi:hypothetical protein
MDDSLIVVEGYVVTPADDTDLRRDVWSFALDQRAFGPRRLVVAFTNRSGRLLSLAHARRTDPPEAALEACIQHLGQGAAAAVAFCDEPVADGPAPVSLLVRYTWAGLTAERYGIHLVDWISCDDTLMRSTRLSIDPRGEWWNVPQEPIGRSRPLQVVRRGPAGETRWAPRRHIKRRP